MTRHATRQIALTTLFICCIMLIALTVASGMNVTDGAVITQALPVAIVCGAALAILCMETADTTR